MNNKIEHTYLDLFINDLLVDKAYAYKLFKNWYNNVVCFLNNTKIYFNVQTYNYNENNDEDNNELNNYINLFKSFINNLIKNHICYDYIKNICKEQLEYKLNTNLLKDEYDIHILNTYWLLNYIDNDKCYFLEQYFNNNDIIISY
jgi:hypothetical protein